MVPCLQSRCAASVLETAENVANEYCSIYSAWAPGGGQAATTTSPDRSYTTEAATSTPTQTSSTQTSGALPASGNLSAGGIAGAAISSVIGAVLVCSAAFYFGKRYARNVKRQEEEVEEQRLPRGSIASEPAVPIGKSELGGSERHEMSNDSEKPAELEGDMPQERDGDVPKEER